MSSLPSPSHARSLLSPFALAGDGDRADRAIGRGIYITLSAAMLAAGLAVFGLVTTLALLLAVGLHELGHFLFLKVAGFQPRMFITPFIGCCWAAPSCAPRYMPAIAYYPGHNILFNAFGQGLYLVAGISLSLGVAWLMTSPLAAKLFSDSAAAEMLGQFWGLLIILNAINLLGGLPTDGSKMLIQAFAGGNPAACRLFAAISLVMGTGLFMKINVFFGSVFLVISILSFKDAVAAFGSHAARPTLLGRLWLLSLWATHLAGTLALMLGNPWLREIVLSMFKK